MGELKKEYKKKIRKKQNNFDLYCIGMLRYAQSLCDRIQAFMAEEVDGNQAYYYPDFFGDVSAEARRHYNIKAVGTDSSLIEGLRKYNNTVKRSLIEYCVADGCTVLDLACGHGQDMLKYNDKKVRHYIGIDISKEEIREARRRQSRSESARDSSTTRKALKYRAEFHVGNLLHDDAYAALKKRPSSKVDIVSCQLAIHYCLINQQAADDLLQRISQHLNQGGLFIGSTVCCDQIASRLFNTAQLKRNYKNGIQSYQFGNGCYSASFDQKTFHHLQGTEYENDDGWETNGPIPNFDSFEELRHKLRSQWGIRYHFWLVETIDAAEYVVPWQSFKEVASSHSLELILSCTFDKYVDNMVKKEEFLGNWMSNQGKNVKLDHQQMEVFSVYKVFVFQKQARSNITGEVLPLEVTARRRARGPI
eukprot:GHVN01104869.1.p1 GENE.GHVN01104869.1~~GHVN01104869.1.p1  ORF type:complete len:452 (-),score=75.05 GHVN01104869.1:88-1347(-)